MILAHDGLVQIQGDHKSVLKLQDRILARRYDSYSLCRCGVFIQVDPITFTSADRVEVVPEENNVNIAFSSDDNGSRETDCKVSVC